MWGGARSRRERPMRQRQCLVRLLYLVVGVTGICLYARWAGGGGWSAVGSSMVVTSATPSRDHTSSALIRAPQFSNNSVDDHPPTVKPVQRTRSPTTAMPIKAPKSLWAEDDDGIARLVKKSTADHATAVENIHDTRSPTTAMPTVAPTPLWDDDGSTEAPSPTSLKVSSEHPIAARTRSPTTAMPTVAPTALWDEDGSTEAPSLAPPKVSSEHPPAVEAIQDTRSPTTAMPTVAPTAPWEDDGDAEDAVSTEAPSPSPPKVSPKESIPVEGVDPGLHGAGDHSMIVKMLAHDDDSADPSPKVQVGSDPASEVQDYIQASNRVYRGTFTEDPEFWRSTCGREETSLLMCDLLENSADGGLRRKEAGRRLTRWQPAPSPALSHQPGCPFRYFNQTEAVGLLRSMGITRVHVVGDSMARYGCHAAVDAQLLYAEPSHRCA
jgi:hypothetical protein